MLPERYRELLTAYVDGELSARQRRHALRLLRRSPEARGLLQRLQDDSKSLRSLPRPRLDRDFSGPVLQKIAGSRPLPMRPIRRFAVPRAFPSWVGVAAAAAVLLVIGTASYCFFSSLDRSAAPAVALSHAKSSADAPPVKPSSSHEADIASHPEAASGTNHTPPPPANDVAHDKPADLGPSPSPDKEEPVYTSEGMELFVELKSVVPSVDVPATFKMHDLAEDVVHRKLVGELRKDGALRVELPVPAGRRAFERLQPALKAHHVDTLIDATAQRRLFNPDPRARTNFVLYTEDLTAEELAGLLQQLGADDKKSAEKKAADGLFDALVVHRLTERDHKELAELMGVDPTAVAPPATGPLGVDPHKPISDGTGAQVAAALGQGKPGAKPAADHAMLVMPYNPVRPKRDSAEVRRFLDERKPLRSGALQVLLVVRGPSAQ